MLKVISKISKMKSICECSVCGEHYETNHYDARKSPLGDKCKKCKSTTGQELNQALVTKFYDYNPLTGELTAKLPQHGIKVGDVMGSNHSGGYLEMGIGSKSYLVHRIIWLHQKGYLPHHVDHVDHNRKNNRWDNLREVSSLDNSKNTSLSTNSNTKINGVSFMKSRNKYRASITVNRKQIHLGLFDTLEEAKAAREAADAKYKFHPNHGK